MACVRSEACFAWQVDGKLGKGKLLLELRMLKLADEQGRLRAAVEREQEDVQGLSERNYRKFVRNCLRQRIEIIKQVSRKAFWQFLTPVSGWISLPTV